MLRKIELTPTKKLGFFERYKYVIALIIIIAIAIGWKPIQNIFFQKNFDNSKINIVIPKENETAQELQVSANEDVGNTSTDLPIDNSSDVSNTDVSNTDVSNESTINEYILSVGDTLAKVLESYDIGVSDVYTLTQQFPDLSNKLRPGQIITWSIDDEGRLQTLTWNVSRKETRIYERSGDSFKESIDLTQGEWQERLFAGEIGREGNNTFIGSAQLAGLAVSERYNAARFLEFQISFKTLRIGDKFSVLVERELVNNEHVSSRFLAAKMRNRGKDRYVIYFEKYRGYYDENGQPLADGFLRIPVLSDKKFRISSPFNPARLHPITGRISPHNGTDFAMPVGTPVVAAGDGEIVVARYGPAAGNYVAIRHGRQYMTRYLHLSRFVVKPGQIVKRGDIIGYSGNTGRSTGPHLHYEFHVNNRPVNPLKIDLPRPEGLVGDDLKEFKKYAETVKAKLDDAIKNMPAVTATTSNATDAVVGSNATTVVPISQSEKAQNEITLTLPKEISATVSSAPEESLEVNSEASPDISKDVSKDSSGTNTEDTSTSTIIQAKQQAPVAGETAQPKKKSGTQRRLAGDPPSADITNDASLHVINGNKRK